MLFDISNKWLQHNTENQSEREKNINEKTAAAAAAAATTRARE